MKPLASAEKAGKEGGFILPTAYGKLSAYRPLRAWWRPVAVAVWVEVELLVGGARIPEFVDILLHKVETQLMMPPDDELADRSRFAACPPATEERA